MTRCRAAEQRRQHGLVDLCELTDRRDAAGAQLLRRHPADAPDALDRQRVKEVQLACKRHDEQTVGLRERARDLREELRTGDPDADGQPDPFADLLPQPDRDLDRGACDALHPADVEKRLVDRQSFDERRRVVEHVVEGLARLGVGRHAWRDDDRLGAEPLCFAPAHRRADAVGLGLVARRQHHAAADDHRAAAQAWVVALLDRREERVRVRVQDRPHS